MEKSGDYDSDGGSISWEDFFGSSTDLVPTLLSMYDSLIAQGLSSSDQLRHTNPHQHQHQHRHHQDHYDTSDPQLRWVSMAVSSNSTTTSSTSGPSPLTLEQKNAVQLQQEQRQVSSTHHTHPSSNNQQNHHHRDLKTESDWKHSSSPSCNSNTNNKNSTSRNCNSNISNSVGSRHPKLSSNSVSSTWSECSTISKTKIMTMKSNSLEDSTRSSSSSSSSSRLLNLSVGGSSKEQRPLSVNSTVSSASSSSCSSDASSASLSNPHGLALAPRASPEEEDVAPIPDADISDDDESHQTNHNYRCAKSSDQTNNVNNGTERCFNNNSTGKDCAENGSRNNRISYPIPAQGRPRFCDPNLSYMDRVVMEIVETERMYVNDLQEIISGYLEHWQLEPDEKLPVHDIQELFSNIEEIHQFNSQFLKLVEGCGLNPVQVARCFVTKNEGFSIYTQYCTNYPRTMSILTEMMRQELSAKSFRERQASLGHTLPLGSYLLKPVQRILKYHLLLQNIVKHYDHGADGYDTIVEALSAMTNIAHHINDMKRRHEHAVRVQEIQSLLYGWQGEDLTTYGELCAEGTFRVYGAKALRHVFLFDKMLLITKKKDDGILSYKSHIMCSNLMLIESVPGEPLSFHVIPFDNPRFQCTLQARNLDQKREWTLQLKRVILENYHAVIPSHARQLVMELGQCRPEDEQVISEKAPTKRQHSAPEYLERRKQEKERRKSESTLKARLRRGKKGDPTSPKESPGAFRRSRRTSMDTNRDRSESRDREVAIDRKMSSASCPPCGTTEKRLVKKLSGWRRKSEPGFYLHPNLKLGKGNGLISRNDHGTSDLTLDSNESIGEEDVGELELESASQIDLCTEEENELDDNNLEQLVPNVEERRESVEEIVGQLVMQNRDFQRILNKQRLVHLRKALAQHQQRQHLHTEEETASETETEEPIDHCRSQKKLPIEKQKGHGHGRVDSCGSQASSSNGIGSSSDVNENSSENISIDSHHHHHHDELILTSKNVQRTVSDPGNKATLTPRRFISGPFGHYDPISLLWSSFRRTDRSSAGSNKQTNSPSQSKGKTNIRHTHSFTCSHKESSATNHPVEPKESLPLPHGDSGVFPNSFTSDSSSSSEANIPTLPAVWLKQQDEHLATPNNKSGSLPRSFQVCQHSTSNSNSSSLVPKIIPNNCNLVHEKNHANHHHNHSGFGFKSRLRDGGKYADRPFTIASDKPSTSDISYDEMEQYMSKFNDQRAMERKSPSTLLTENDVDDLTTLTGEVTPVTSMENLSLHPDHKIYRSSKSSIKHMLMSVTYRLSGIKSNMIVGGNGHANGSANNTNGTAGSNSNRGHASVNFGSFPNIVTSGDSSGNNTAANNKESPLPTRNGYSNVVNGKNGSNLMSSRNYRKSLKQKIKHIVREDRDSDSENCESVTCSSGSSGFGSLGSCGSSSNNLTSKIGARLAQCCEHSDYALSKLLGSSSCPDAMLRPQSVMSVSSTMTSTSSTSTDEKTSSGLGESLSSEGNNDLTGCNGENGSGGYGGLGRDGSGKKLYRLNRKGINHRDLYLSYIDQEHEQDVEGLSDSDASADSFYERSFEAIENFLENEIFPDSAIYSDQDENGSVSSGSRLNNWSTLEDSINESLCSYHHLHSDGNSMPMSNGQSSGIAIASSLAASLTHGLSLALPPPVPNKPPSESRRSRLVRSQVILEKLKHLEECSQFHREEPPSPSFEGIKSIQERRKELDMWRGTTGNGPPGHCSNREDESETSSQHSTSTINTVIELSPSKSTSFPSSRRCSDTDSSGGNSPLTERAVSRSSSCQGHLIHNQSNSSGDPMTKGWVKLVVGKLQGTENSSP